MGKNNLYTMNRIRTSIIKIRFAGSIKKSKLMLLISSFGFMLRPTKQWHNLMLIPLMEKYF